MPTHKAWKFLLKVRKPLVKKKKKTALCLCVWFKRPSWKESTKHTVLLEKILSTEQETMHTRHSVSNKL